MAVQLRGHHVDGMFSTLVSDLRASRTLIYLILFYSSIAQNNAVKTRELWQADLTSIFTNGDINNSTFWYQ